MIAASAAVCAIQHGASDGTEAVYRFIGHGEDFPQREVTDD